jgi:hypothetical protein
MAATTNAKAPGMPIIVAKSTDERFFGGNILLSDALDLFASVAMAAYRLGLEFGRTRGRGINYSARF